MPQRAVAGYTNKSGRAGRLDALGGGELLVGIIYVLAGAAKQ
jgi:hypothetical protein